MGRWLVLLIILLVSSSSAMGTRGKKGGGEGKKAQPLPVLKISGEEHNQALEMKDMVAKEGYQFTTTGAVTLECPLLPQQVINFDGPAVETNEYVILLPPAKRKKKKGDPSWIQLVFDYPVDVVDCEGCGGRLLVEPLHDTDYRNVFIPVAADEQKVSLRVLNNLPEKAEGLFLKASGILSGDEILYFDMANESLEPPTHAVVFASFHRGMKEQK